MEAIAQDLKDDFDQKLKAQSDHLETLIKDVAASPSVYAEESASASVGDTEPIEDEDGAQTKGESGDDTCSGGGDNAYSEDDDA